MKETLPMDADLCSKSPAQLKAMPDDDLTRAYERQRDQQEPHTGAFPNIQSLCATPVEREKDRRETHVRAQTTTAEMHRWYEKARTQPCTWWLKNQISAKHSVNTCISCGVCTSQCPSAEFYEDFTPREIVDAALSLDEDRLAALLSSDILWLCGQCGSCIPKCPRQNNPMRLISSLRLLAQLKGYHVSSVRGRQQYVLRHVLGANLWNRGFSLYFRNVTGANHPDFGPRYARYHADADRQMERIGACPDKPGAFGGRKLAAETIAQLRACLEWGGTLALWDEIEKAAEDDARQSGLTIEEYFAKAATEG
jgi:heterodisulfide reductase subunit C